MNFLLEIATEELPTAAVADLSEAGATLWAELLIEHGFSCEQIETFATPRRLAWRIISLSEKQVPQIEENQGPALKIAKDAQGNWTKAAIGFATSCGLQSPDELSTIDTPKGVHLYHRSEKPAKTFAEMLPTIFAKLIAKLPIAKRMRWANHEQSFVRPVNSIVALADSTVLPLEFFGLQSGRNSQGHRVHHPAPVIIEHADTYERDLEKACVIAKIAVRREKIATQVQAMAEKLGGIAIMPEALLDEVAALTEYPQAIHGEFEARYLEVPQEVLITTMQENQKTFAIVDAQGKMLPYFIAVANLVSRQPEAVSMGNERVIRPRFADAEFFWQQDLKQRLEDRLTKLENVIYQAKLGSIAEKTRRVSKLAEQLMTLTHANKDNVLTAARLAKSDLLSEMVMEFPELQGYMGRQYALKEGLNAEIAAALEEQYFPLSAGGTLPQTATGTTLAIAEKLDTIVGGFAIGAKPTGSKDPYALRRMAIALIRLIVEKNLTLPLTEWLEKAAANYPPELKAHESVADIREYILERLQAHYREQDIAIEVYQAVRAIGSDNLLDFDQRIKTLQTFLQQDSSASFLASAKRIRNILKKNGENTEEVKNELLEETAEKTLWHHWQPIQADIQKAISQGHYTDALNALHPLASPLEAFFTEVMVMTDNEALKNNRLALLTSLQQGFNQFGDLSLLSVN